MIYTPPAIVDPSLTTVPVIDKSDAANGRILVSGVYTDPEVGSSYYSYEWTVTLTFQTAGGETKSLTLSDTLAHGSIASYAAWGTLRAEDGTLTVDTNAQFIMNGQSHKGFRVNSTIINPITDTATSYRDGYPGYSWARDGNLYHTQLVYTQPLPQGPKYLEIVHQPHLDWLGTEVEEYYTTATHVSFSIPTQQITTQTDNGDGTCTATETHVFALQDYYPDEEYNLLEPVITVSEDAPFTQEYTLVGDRNGKLTVTVTRSNVTPGTKSEVTLTLRPSEDSFEISNTQNISVLTYPATFSLRSPVMAAAAPVAPATAPTPAPALPAGNRLENVRAEASGYVFDKVHTFTDLPGEPESIRFFRDGAQIHPDFTTTMAQDVLTVTVQDQQLPADGSGTIRCELWYGGRCHFSRALTVNQALLEGS